VIQQGQVFKLKARGTDGEPLWAYRYRAAGRGSSRLQMGGFATRAEAQRALQNKLGRLWPGGRPATLTLGEWVEEYLDAHQGERVTVAKLRWLLGKATAELGEVRLAELSPEQVCAWRLTVPEGHRFEATQALRQVLNRAVAWKLIDENPAKRGVPNPSRRCREQRPFESWAQIRAVAERLGPLFGPMARQATAAGRQPAAVPERTWRPPRLPQLQPAPLETRPESRRDRTAARPLRPAPHLRHLRAPRRRAGVCPLPVHAHEHRDDRPPLRPPRSRQLPARRLAARRARARTGGGRWVDAGAQARKAARRHGFQASRKRLSAGGGRSVDTEATTSRDAGRRKGLISRNFASPLTDSNRRPPPYHGTPQATDGSRWQRIWLVSAVFRGLRFASDCHGLRPLGSISAPSASGWLPLLSRWSSSGHAPYGRVSPLS
jgi:hypothetical protein